MPSSWRRRSRLRKSEQSHSLSIPLESVLFSVFRSFHSLPLSPVFFT